LIPRTPGKNSYTTVLNNATSDSQGSALLAQVGRGSKRDIIGMPGCTGCTSLVCTYNAICHPDLLKHPGAMRPKGPVSSANSTRENQPFSTYRRIFCFRPITYCAHTQDWVRWDSVVRCIMLMLLQCFNLSFLNSTTGHKMNH